MLITDHLLNIVSYPHLKTWNAVIIKFFQSRFLLPAVFDVMFILNEKLRLQNRLQNSLVLSLFRKRGKIKPKRSAGCSYIHWLRKVNNQTQCSDF